MTTTRNNQTNRDRSLDQWALTHYVASQHKLDLSEFSFWYTTGSGRYQPWHLDTSFKSKLLPFMKGIGGFLDEYPSITNVSINGMNGYWEPNIEIPQLIANQRLKNLDLGATGVTESDVTELLNKPSLTSLNLSQNNIENITFQGNPNLKTLYISNNKINAKAVDALSHLENLENLNVSKNILRDELAEEVLKNLPHLKKVNLENTKITKETANVLLKNTQLTDISVSICEVGCWNKFQLWRLESKNAKLSKSKAGLFQPNNKEAVPEPQQSLRPAIK